jgi:hypothetical protein
MTGDPIPPHLLGSLLPLLYDPPLFLALSLSLSSTDLHFAVHIVPKTQQTVTLQYAVKPPTVITVWQCRYSSNTVLSFWRWVGAVRKHTVFHFLLHAVDSFLVMYMMLQSRVPYSKGN